MRSAVIAVIVAALVGAATAGAGTILITGRQIRDHSIGLVDLSSSARRALTGPRPSIPPPLRTVTVRRSAGLEDGVASTVAFCPPGMVVLGGAVSPHGLHVTRAEPFLGVLGVGWAGEAVDLDEFKPGPAPPARIDVTAICAEGSYNGPR